MEMELCHGWNFDLGWCEDLLRKLMSYWDGEEGINFPFKDKDFVTQVIGHEASEITTCVKAIDDLACMTMD